MYFIYHWNNNIFILIYFDSDKYFFPDKNIFGCGVRNMTGARVIRLNGCSPAPGSSIYQPQLLEKQLAVLDSPQVEERRIETRGNPTKEIDVTDENTVDG